MSFETPGPIEAQLRDAISPIEEIIEEARQGGCISSSITRTARMKAIW